MAAPIILDPSRVLKDAFKALAPLTIVNNKSQNAPGEALGLYIHIGDNPTATPSAGDSVAATITINNLNGRSRLWGLNITALQDGTGTDGPVRAAEFEVATILSENPDPFAFAGNPRKNGIEIVHHAASSKRGTAAIFAWSGNLTNSWSRGVALSRIRDVGIDFGLWDTDAPGESFRTAAIYDRSGSASVLKVDGSHGSIIDLSNLADALFVKMKATSGQTLSFKNGADHPGNLRIDVGETACQQSLLMFADRGVDKWSLFKNINNDFGVFRYTDGISVLYLNASPTDPLSIYVGGALRQVTIGNADSGGAGYRVLKVLN